MSETTEKVGHVLSKTASGAIKGAMWGAIAAAVLGIAAAALAVPTLGISLGTWAFAAPSTMALIGYGAAAGGGLGLIEGVSTSNVVVEEHLAIQKKQISQSNMMAALQERQQAINAGYVPSSVLAPGMLPPQQAAGMQRV